MAGLSLKTIISKLTKDIFVQTNVLSSEGNQIAIVPLGEVDNYEHFMNVLARELSTKVGKILVVKVDHMENSGLKIQNKERFEELVDMEKKINVIYTTQIVNSSQEYNKMLLTHSTLLDFFNKFSIVLFQYDVNVFEKNPRIFEVQKNVITLVNRKETPVESILNIKKIKDRFEFEFLASIIL